MAQSSNTDFTLTAAQLFTSAATELGAIGMGDSLEASEEAEMQNRLNMMLAKWSIEANLWRNETGTVSFGLGVPAVTLPSEVRDIRACRYIQSSTYKRPLAPWNRDEYLMIPNRAQTGAPMAYYFTPKVGGAQLTLWPVPNAAMDFEIDYSRRFYQIEEPTQEVDIPPEWHEAVLYGLAARCASMFGTTRVDPATVQRIEAQAATEFNRMLDADRPDTYSFGWDSPVEAG